MSKLTEILKLFCYDPETDGNLTFNVTEALTKNWEKIDQLVLLAVAAAAAYDPEGSYAVGDYCTHGGKLHKCNTPISGGEAWNAAHWTETSVAAELAEVRASLSNKVGNQALEVPNSDCNDIANFGLYRIRSSTANCPATATIGDTLINAPWDVNTIFQLFLGGTAGKIFWRARVNIQQNPWSNWFPLANATPPEEHAIVPKNGATLIDGFKNSYSKDQFGRVFVYFSLHFENVPERNTEIFSLPQSFAPTGGTVVGAAGLSMASQFPAFVVAHENGVVTVDHYITEYSGTMNLHGFLVIDTGGTQ